MKLFSSLLVAICLFLSIPAEAQAAPKSGIAGQLFLSLCNSASLDNESVCLALPQSMKGTILVTQEKVKKIRVGKKRVRSIVQVLRAVIETDEKGFFYAPLKPGTYQLFLDEAPGMEHLVIVNGRNVKIPKKRFVNIDLITQPK